MRTSNSKTSSHVSSRIQLFVSKHQGTISICVCVQFVLIMVSWQVMYPGHEQYVIPRPAAPNEFQYYITIHHNGQLGNQMFDYTGLRGIAQRNKMNPCINHHDFKSLLSPFSININECKSGLRNSTKIFETENITKTLSIVHNLPKKNITLMGHFISFQYFEDIVDDIRRDFTFKSHIKKTALDILYKARPNNWHNKQFIQVGLHVRRTDMITKRRQKMGYVSTKMSYFKNAMDYFISNHSHVQFVIASDDISWCRQHLSITKPGVAVHFLSGNSPPVDMAVLSSCDHVIISLGTFGWWAGWLCQGQTVYNKNLAPRNTHHWHMTHKGHFPESWIPIV